jgi:hypothetical protein
MKRCTVFATLTLIASGAMAAAACDGSPSIPQWSQRDYQQLCGATTQVLGTTAPEVFRRIEKAVYVLKFNGSKTAPRENATAFARIVSLRGHGDNPALAMADIDVAVKTYSAFEGKITPMDIAGILRASGNLARTLDEDGFIYLIVMQKNAWEQSGEWDARSINR